VVDRSAPLVGRERRALLADPPEATAHLARVRVRVRVRVRARVRARARTRARRAVMSSALRPCASRRAADAGEARRRTTPRSCAC